jgi:hypothetical protein
MMIYNYDLVIEEDRPQFDPQGQIINNPFSNLKHKANLLFYHAFITEDLMPDERLEDLRFFYLYFHGEKHQRKGKKTVQEKPTWDSVFKAEILRSLTSRHLEWKISIFGTLWNPKYNCEYRLQRDIEADLYYTFWKSSPKKLTEFRNSNKNFRFRSVYQIDNHLIEMIASKYFQQADALWPNQGYLTPNDEKWELHQLDLWDRDIDLFMRFLEHCPISFFSFPDTNQHLCFVTNQYSLAGFKEKIMFDDIRSVIRQLQ